MYWEKKEKYKILSVPTKKKIRKTDKEGNEAVETISYKIKFFEKLWKMWEILKLSQPRGEETV